MLPFLSISPFGALRKAFHSDAPNFTRKSFLRVIALTQLTGLSMHFPPPTKPPCIMGFWSDQSPVEYTHRILVLFFLTREGSHLLAHLRISNGFAPPSLEAGIAPTVSPFPPYFFFFRVMSPDLLLFDRALPVPPPFLWFFFAFSCALSFCYPIPHYLDYLLELSPPASSP